MYNSKTSETEPMRVASFQMKIKRSISVLLLVLILPPSFPARVTTLVTSYLCFFTSYEWKLRSLPLVSGHLGFSLLAWITRSHVVTDCSFLWPWTISLRVFPNLPILLLKTYVELPVYSVMECASINLLVYDFWWIYVNLSVGCTPGIGVPGF